MSNTRLVSKEMGECHIADWVIRTGCLGIDELEGQNNSGIRKDCAEKFQRTNTESSFLGNVLPKLKRIIIKEFIGQYTSLIGDGIGQLFDEFGTIISIGSNAVIDKIFDLFIAEETNAMTLIMAEVQNGEEISLPIGEHDIVFTFLGDQERAIVRKIPVTEGSETNIEIAPGEIIEGPPPEPEPSTKFSIGDLVQVNTGDGSNLNVRSTPNGSIVGQQPDGAQGTVIGGPVFAGVLWWWEIDYENDPDGWSAEDFLELAPPSDQRANLSIVLEPNPVPQNALDAPCLDIVPAWDFFVTVAETAGVGITITSFTWDFFDDAGNHIGTQTDTGDTFADWFDQCGPGSSRIAPSEQACGPLCAHLGTRDSGSIIFTFFGTDDNGNDISSQSEPLILLGSEPAVVRRLHQESFTSPQVTRR